MVNIKNDELECFKWSVLAALHPALKHAQRVTKYQDYKDELKFEGINFPVSIDKISKFEKQNPGISITITGITNDKKNKKREEGGKEDCPRVYSDGYESS